MTITIRLELTEKDYHGLVQLKGLLSATTWNSMAEKISSREFLEGLRAMETKIVMQRRHMPWVAEALVMERFSEWRMTTTKLPHGQHCDFLCSNGARVEVKSSTPQRTRPNDPWTFSGLAGRNCDYFVLVGFDLEYYPNYFIIPSGVIDGKVQIRIGIEDEESEYLKYKEHWDPIRHFKKA